MSSRCKYLIYNTRGIACRIIDSIKNELLMIKGVQGYGITSDENGRDLVQVRVDKNKIEEVTKTLRILYAEVPTEFIVTENYSNIDIKHD